MIKDILFKKVIKNLHLYIHLNKKWQHVNVKNAGVRRLCSWSYQRYTKDFQLLCSTLKNSFLWQWREICFFTRMFLSSYAQQFSLFMENSWKKRQQNILNIRRHSWKSFLVFKLNHVKIPLSFYLTFHFIKFTFIAHEGLDAYKQKK